MPRCRVRKNGHQWPRIVANINSKKDLRQALLALGFQQTTKPVMYTHDGHQVLHFNALTHDELVYLDVNQRPFLPPSSNQNKSQRDSEPEKPHLPPPSNHFLQHRRFDVEEGSDTSCSSESGIVTRMERDLNSSTDSSPTVCRYFAGLLPPCACFSRARRRNGPIGSSDASAEKGEPMAVGLFFVKDRERGANGQLKKGALVLALFVGLILALACVYLILNTALNAARLRNVDHVCEDDAPPGCARLPQGCQLASPWMLPVLERATSHMLRRLAPGEEEVMIATNENVSPLARGLSSLFFDMYGTESDNAPYLRRSNDTILNMSVAQIVFGSCWSPGAARIQLIPDRLAVRFNGWSLNVESRIEVEEAKVSDHIDDQKKRQLSLWEGQGHGMHMFNNLFHDDSCSCNWKEDYACPKSINPGKLGYAQDDGSFCFNYCCHDSVSVASGKLSSTWIGWLHFDNISLPHLGLNGASVNTCSGDFTRDTAAVHLVFNPDVPHVAPDDAKLDEEILSVDATGEGMGDTLTSELCGNRMNVSSLPSEWDGVATELDLALDAALPALRQKAEFIMRILAVLVIFVILLIAAFIRAVFLATSDGHLAAVGGCCCHKVEGYESVGSGACCCHTVRREARQIKEHEKHNDFYAVVHHVINCLDCCERCCD